MDTIDDFLSIYKADLEQWIETTEQAELEEHLFVAACAKNRGVLSIDVQAELDKSHPLGLIDEVFLKACVHDFELLPHDMKGIIEQYAHIALEEMQRLELRWMRCVDLEELAKYNKMAAKRKQSYDSWEKRI